MSLALHYWMGDAHHCSGFPSLKWPILCRVGVGRSTLVYHTINGTCDYLRCRYWLSGRIVSHHACLLVWQNQNIYRQDGIALMFSHLLTSMFLQLNGNCICYDIWLIYTNSSHMLLLLFTKKFLSYISMHMHSTTALCGLRGCKSWPTPFPGWMSYKATKPGLALSVVYRSMFYCNVVY